MANDNTSDCSIWTLSCWMIFALAISLFSRCSTDQWSRCGLHLLCVLPTTARDDFVSGDIMARTKLQYKFESHKSNMFHNTFIDVDEGHSAYV
jgi:hypothetical protein